VIQEYLDSPEYTIDVLCDMRGRPVQIVPRERVVIRAGVIDRGRTVKWPALIELAQQTCNAMRFMGALNIQCRLREGWPAIFEINPRFSGGIPLTIAAGADFPKLLIKMALGVDVQPAIGDFKEGTWMTSYETSFFLDESSLRLPVCEARPRIGEVA
jgi:carbamoyl-phosphate synthase large subunit